ncbi:HAMP domain-containing sensor histidine kinase [Aliiglaciecola lipolytica]|nr:HAMP domain-containing sensor histidine kinase [Aliiglaciecola lipolytica]
MKIRPSLKLYFFMSVVLLGSVMVFVFSFLSVSYYVDGLDRGVNGMMFELSKSTEVEDGQPQSIAGFHVASRWQDTPEIIQQRFKTPPTVEGQLQKQKVQTMIFTLPKNLFFMVMYFNPQGEQRFISRVMLEEDIILTKKVGEPTNRFIWAVTAAIIGIALFAFFLVMIMKKIAKPIESLKGWAKSLEQGNLQKTPPDFTYNELNVLASLVQSSLISAHQSIEREQLFLSYASHELRTPIAVIRSNVDLLQRLNEKQPTTEKQQLTLQRIQRAGLTMSNLTDTFLWLSRNEELNISPEPIPLGQIINQACSDLEYLLSGKNVEVKIESEECSVTAVAVACHIVVNNLIRNAYQHTQHGYVHIKQQGSRVSIINSNVKEESNPPVSDSKNNQVAFGYGYGLGLQLSEKIIKHHNWFYEKENQHGCYQVIVDFRSTN